MLPTWLPGRYALTPTAPMAVWRGDTVLKVTPRWWWLVRAGMVVQVEPGEVDELCRFQALRAEVDGRVFECEAPGDAVGRKWVSRAVGKGGAVAGHAPVR